MHSILKAYKQEVIMRAAATFIFFHTYFENAASATLNSTLFSHLSE